MPVCIECGYPVKSLLIRYGEAGSSLCKCDKCGRVADKYLEYDSVTIFIDAVLHKQQPYRHILFNRFSDRAACYRLLGRLFLIFLTVDTFVHWFNADIPLEEESFQKNFLFFLGLCFWEQVVYVFGAIVACKVTCDECSALRIVEAIVFSSFAKLFYLVMVIWDYQELNYSWVLRFFVFTSNTEAIRACISQNFGHFHALGIMAFAFGLQKVSSFGFRRLFS